MKRSRPQRVSRATARDRQSGVGAMALPDSARTRRHRPSRPSLRAAGQELAAARRWGAPGTLARALRLLGTVRREDGHELLREAVLIAEGSPARLEHAKALVASAPRSGEQVSGRSPASPCGAASSSPAAAAHRRLRSGPGRSSTAPAPAAARSAQWTRVTDPERTTSRRARGREDTAIATSRKRCTSRPRRSRCTSRASTASSGSQGGPHCPKRLTHDAN